MINTIIVDNNPLCVEMLADMCQTFGDLIINSFTDSGEAALYAKKNHINLAFLDIEMEGLSGIQLGQTLRNINPDIILMYISSSESGCADAMRLKADAYIFKPYSMADISYAIGKARLLTKNSSQSIAIKTKGVFEIIINNRPIHFSNAKAKELLALCIRYRGYDVLMDTAISLLWPGRSVDEKTKRLYRKAVLCIKKTLGNYTSSALFTSSRGSCRVNPVNFKCDYYHFLSKNSNSSHRDNALYFSTYPWSTAVGCLINNETEQVV